MPALSDIALIGVWERGRSGNAVTRAMLLAAASAEFADRDPADLTISERDGAILRLRAATFGKALQGYTDCRRCGERLEFDFDCDVLLANQHAPHSREFSAGGLRFRFPNSRDLLAVAAAGDADEAAHDLVSRCCLEPGAVIAGNATLLDQVEASIAAHDPGFDVRLGFACAECAYVWEEPLDIAAWFWDEIELRAQGLFDVVHVLASAYGWSEAQILAMGAARRGAYLERCLA